MGLKPQETKIIFFNQSAKADCNRYFNLSISQLKQTAIDISSFYQSAKLAVIDISFFNQSEEALFILKAPSFH